MKTDALDSSWLPASIPYMLKLKSQCLWFKFARNIVVMLHWTYVWQQGWQTSDATAVVNNININCGHPYPAASNGKRDEKRG